MGQQINLLNLHLVARRDPVSARMLVLLVLGGMLVMTLVYAWMTYRVDLLEKQYAAVTGQLGSLRNNVEQALQARRPKQADPALLESIAETEAAVRGRQEILKFFQDGVAAKGPQYGYSSYMQAFSRQTLEGVWLTGFSIDDEAQQIEIQGYAIQPELVPRYLGMLGLEPLLKGREFSMLQIVGTTKAGAAGKDTKAPLPRMIEFKLKSVEHPPAKAGVGGAQS